MNALEESVIRFVADFTGVAAQRIKPDTTILGDLGVDGDDAAELIQKFAEEFGVPLTAFQFDRHFGPEGMHPLAPFVLIWHLLTRPFRKSETPEESCGAIPIRVSDLVAAAENKTWAL